MLNPVIGCMSAPRIERFARFVQDVEFIHVADIFTYT